MNKITLACSLMFVTVTLVCCINRSYLTEQEKSWNPYKADEVLVFGTADGSTDTLKVTSATGGHFPEGIGSPDNERLEVVAMVNVAWLKRATEQRIFYITSKSSKQSTDIDFELILKGGKFFGHSYSLESLENYPAQSVKTPYGTFDDVIVIEDNSNRHLKDEDITRIYWSKSKGYVRCKMKDGTIWDLINIIDPV